MLPVTPAGNNPPAPNGHNPWSPAAVPPPPLPPFAIGVEASALSSLIAAAGTVAESAASFRQVGAPNDLLTEAATALRSLASRLAGQIEQHLAAGLPPVQEVGHG